jgi:hypothetical protein
MGQIAMVGAFWFTPSSRSSLTTPTTSRHGVVRLWRMRLPIAAAGSCQSSRAWVVNGGGRPRVDLDGAEKSGQDRQGGFRT